jgi:hypothetical protein
MGGRTNGLVAAGAFRSDLTGLGGCSALLGDWAFATLRAIVLQTAASANVLQRMIGRLFTVFLGMLGISGLLWRKNC